MRYAIFSDIHSNLEALQAVLLDASKQEATVFICLGDIVGYNADPSECVDVVRRLECPIIKGNHDEATLSNEDLPHFNPLAQAGIAFSRRALRPDQRRFLEAAPMMRDFKDFTCVHASLHEPQAWHYISGEREVWHCLQHLKKNLCFIGHTHVPLLCYDDRTGVNVMPMECNRRITLPIKNDRRYLINVGSVGQPRDGDWRACYVIYDNATHSLEFRRVKYDLERTQEKLIAAGLPEPLAQRLFVGR